jgi:hypothetical protein
LGAAQGFRFASRIDGRSARGAAENWFSKFRAEDHPFIDPATPRQISEEDIPDTEPWADYVKRFVLRYGTARLAQVEVAPHGGWWWKIVGSSLIFPSDDIECAKDHWNSDRDEATDRLMEVIRDYPNTKASKRAEDMLRRLRASNSEAAD